jgi:hypothetical protein
MAFGLDSILGGVGDIAGYFAGSGDRDKAMQDLEKARKAYEGVDPNIKAQEAAASGLPAAGAGSRAAQMDALAALQRRYSQGGLDALTRARLARVQTDNSNAGRTAAAAAIEEANRRGTGAGGNAIVNAQVAGQQAANRNAQQTLDIAGQGEQLTAGATRDAANLSGQTRSQDYESAGAQDAINKFNASQRQGAEQATVGNSLDRAGGIAGGYRAQYGAQMDEAKRKQGLWGGVGRTAGGVANYFVNPAGVADQAAQGGYDAASMYGSGV